MVKYKIQQIDCETGEVVEDFVDDMIFNSEDDADEYASYLNSCVSEGAEVLKMSNPFDYDEDYGDGEGYEYVSAEID